MDLNNLVYPENPHLVLPMVLRTYDGEEVVRLDNVEWRDGGLEFDLVLPAPVPAGQPRCALAPGAHLFDMLRQARCAPDAAPADPR